MQERIFLSPPWMGGSERRLVDEAFASGYIAPCGPMLSRFERDFALKVGVPNVCAVSSGTAALDLLFYELGIGAGDLIFCSDLTFIASIAPAVHRGAEPVFIDCSASTWNMDPDLLAEALSDARRVGRLPKAVVAVDLYGQCCDYERLEYLCAAYEVPLIVDAAEALGAVYYGGGAATRTSFLPPVADDGYVSKIKVHSASPPPASQGRQAGSAGWAAVYSFNGNKIITTSGGGMLVSNDAGVVKRACKRSQQSREPTSWYEHCELGYNHRMSNLVAAVGVGQLSYLDVIIAKKRQIFDEYQASLGDIDLIRFMPEAVYGQCTRWLTVIQIGDQALNQSAGISPLVQKVMENLEKQNIESRPVWKPMHLQPVFSGAKYYGGKVSERLFTNGLCLPSGAGLSAVERERVCVYLREAAQ